MALLILAVAARFGATLIMQPADPYFIVTVAPSR
jgi:hypothetical protein